MSIKLRKPQPNEYVLPSTKDLPMNVMHNWNDAAFQPNQRKKQVLSQEFTKGQMPAFAKHQATSISNPIDKLGEVAKMVESIYDNEKETPSNSTYASKEDLILRFYAFYTKSISSDTDKQSRNVTITFYMTDETVQIYEHKERNSGFQGGCLLNRQKVYISRLDVERNKSLNNSVSLLNSNYKQYFKVNDQTQDIYVLSIHNFNIGKSISIGGTIYHIYDCDANTRYLLEKSNIVVPIAIDPLSNPDYISNPNYFAKSSWITTSDNNNIDLSDNQNHLLGVPLHDGKVLAFKAYWRDPETSILRLVKIKYTIKSKYISMTELTKSKEHTHPLFLSYTKIPRCKSLKTTLGLSNKSAYSVNFEESDQEYYTELDFKIGGEIHVHGREFFIYDCDDYTREYYASVLNAPLDASLDISHLLPQAPVQVPIEICAPTGIGTSEDTLASCKKLMPQPPQKRIDPLTSNHKMLIFIAVRVDHAELPDNQRQFKLCYYTEDQTIELSELIQPNSGYTNKKICSRSKVIKPGYDISGDFYTLDDLYLGAVITINGFQYSIHKICKYTDTYLKNIKTKGYTYEDLNIVSKSRLNLIIQQFVNLFWTRFSTIREGFRYCDRDKDGFITLPELMNIMVDLNISYIECEAIGLLEWFSHFSNIETNNKKELTYKIDFNAFNKAITHATINKSNVFSDINTESIKDIMQKDTEVSSIDIKQRHVLMNFKKNLDTKYFTMIDILRICTSTVNTETEKKKISQPSHKDASLTPYLLHKGITEVMGLNLSDTDIQIIMKYFFDGYKNTNDYLKLSYQDFQQKIIQLDHLLQL